MDFTLDPAALFASLLIPAQILFVNLLLSADNALVIAMACRGLPREEIRRATLIGTVGAICLRIAMGCVALFLIRIPYLRVVASLILLMIAIRLTLQRDDEENHDADDGGHREGSHSFHADGYGAGFLAGLAACPGPHSG